MQVFLVMMTLNHNTTKRIFNTPCTFEAPLASCERCIKSVCWVKKIMFKMK